MRTLIPGALTVLSAYPDPPFDIMKDGVASGFDIELMRAVSRRLSLELRPLAYTGISTASSQGWSSMRRGDFGYHDHVGTRRTRAVLATLFGVQPGNRRQSTPDARCHLDRRAPRPHCGYPEGEHFGHCRSAVAGA